MAARGEFSSRLGFILAAAGSAVGLGNIWGFPTQVASNGGAAFVLVYLVLAFALAYPVLMAELVIGRATRANMIDALFNISGKRLGRWVGIWGCVTVSLILAFYAIVGGWMMAYLSSSAAQVMAQPDAAEWVTTFSPLRNLLFCFAFLLATAYIVLGGVQAGIEKWSVRLMPTLVVLIVGLIVYVSFQAGASEGWRVYLVPDFSVVFDGHLLMSAMGQAFFSMSLGVGTMLVYGSYVSKSENLPVVGASVALVDIGIAVLAGMLIIPAMYVASHLGVDIFADDGSLIRGDQLIFVVLPALFSSMGDSGILVSAIFFSLMTIAALTSSISMLEVPVAYLVERWKLSRPSAVVLMTFVIGMLSTCLVFNFDRLFGFIIALTTEYSQPLLGMVVCLFMGWLWRRHHILEELKSGSEQIESSLFWAIWPWYVKFVCPVIILIMFFNSVSE